MLVGKRGLEGVGGGGRKLILVMYRRLVKKINFRLLVFPETRTITNPKVNTLYTVILNPNIMCSTNAYCVSQLPTKSQHGNVYESGKLSCIVNV